MYKRIGEEERKIDTNIKMVEKELMPELGKTTEKQSIESTKYRKIVKQLDALNEADEEIIGQLESVLETK